MKKLILPVFALILAVSSCGTDKTASQNSEQTESTASVINLTAKEFAEKSTSGTILDVRTPGEVAQGKIEGAEVIDFYHPDFLDQVSKISKDQEIYIYCAVGTRSEEAARILTQQGFTKVYHLQGGIQAWYQNGFPISQN
jgi:rhodanese-related sulfurtransferase